MKRFSLLFALLLAFAPLAYGQGTLPYYQSPSIEVTGSGTATDEQPVPASDVSRFRWASIQLKGTWTGTVTFEASNDGSTWVSVALISVGSTSTGPVTTATANGIFHGPLSAHYFRARFSTASSGTVTGVADFSTVASNWQAKAATAGGGTVTGLTADSGGTTTGATPTIAGGAGIVTSRSSDTVTVATASSETNFLSAGALTCGASTAGKAQVHTTPLQYCDNAATPALQYAAYGNSAGEATAVANTAVNLTTDVTGVLPVANYAPRTCQNLTFVAPSGDDSVPATAANIAAIGTAGLVECARVTMQCSKTGTALYWRVGVGVASQTCAVAIYDTTGATLIAASPESTTCATSGQNRSATGLSSFSLVAGTEYLMCAASSGTTVQFSGNATAIATMGTTPRGVLGATAVGNKYQANVDCLGSTNPYACCTGVGTGTCTGMPASLGTLTASGGTFAFIGME